MSPADPAARATGPENAARPGQGLAEVHALAPRQSAPEAGAPSFEAEEELRAEHGKAHDRGGARRLGELVDWLRKDLHRYSGDSRLSSFLKHVVFTPGYRYTVFMRTAGYLRRRRALKYTLYPPVKLYLLRLRYKFGIAIPEYTEIGPGLFINRFGGIYIAGDAVIGSNVNITHGVMLGYMNRGPKIGAPRVGDRVFLGAGAKVIGAVTVGADAAVGVNAVVTRDVPPSGVAAGIPAKVISMEGSRGYINRIPPD